MTKPIVLPPDEYDALELSTVAFGPIGYGRLWLDGKPCCVHGHADAVDPTSDVLSCAIYSRGVTASLNDRIVGPGEFVEWDEFCRRGNIVRGEDQ